MQTNTFWNIIHRSNYLYIIIHKAQYNIATIKQKNLSRKINSRLFSVKKSYRFHQPRNDHARNTYHEQQLAKPQNIKPKKKKGENKFFEITFRLEDDDTVSSLSMALSSWRRRRRAVLC